ncbi:MAG: GTPase ObgE [Dehalococcoidia bacterium]|nr:MAG: GTPase ObgE [Dehalococcoidia bacterium]
MINKGEIIVRGGTGGDGCVSFRREKYIRFGGPDGGDGGDGGDAIVVASSSVVDLGLTRRQREFVAGDGRGGSGCRKHGRKGVDLAISVPVGTMVLAKADSGEEMPLADLKMLGESVLVAKGGRGGLGNARFATAANQAPEIATRGKAGEERYIILELKLITDICIIGHPNSGKSTLLSAITRAKPEIADYPFTTRQPVLGVVPDVRRDFVMAEMPGLVRDAHLGKGLGNAFLRHAERTKLLVYLLDGSSPTATDDLSTLEKEIALCKGLSQKPRIVAVNKVDLPEVQARLPQVKQHFAEVGMPVYYISAVSGQAVLELVRKAIAMVDRASQDEARTEQPQIAVFRPKPRK